MRLLPIFCFRLTVMLSAAVAFTACSSISHKPLISATSEKKNIAIFFDGTHNDETSDTNVKRLHALVTLQAKSNIASLYVEGVGTGSDIGGMTTGLGIGPRVRIAYEFMLNNYAPGDKIYIFGFSRGAYAARILTSLLYHAGLPKSDVLSTTAIAEAVYDDVKGTLPRDVPENMRQYFVEQLLVARGISLTAPIEIEVLGLWDTVEALGYPDWGSKLLDKAQIRQHKVVVDNANELYGDKLCNVNFAFHALAIDDDREWVFTPLLLSRKHLFDDCTPERSNPMLDGQLVKRGHLQEVWFSGSHSDVGGGYRDSLLTGVSLNWMIERISRTFDEFRSNILPIGAEVLEDPYGSSHDPESGIFSPIYHKLNRNLVGYAKDAINQRKEFLDRICVHSSVFRRRALIPPKEHENHQLQFRTAGKICLTQVDNDGDISLNGRLIEGLENELESCEPSLIIDVREYQNKMNPCDIEEAR